MSTTSKFPLIVQGLNGRTKNFYKVRSHGLEISSVRGATGERGEDGTDGEGGIASVEPPLEFSGLSTGVLTLPTASNVKGGAVTATAQTLRGLKTLDSGITVEGGSSTLNGGNVDIATDDTGNMVNIGLGTIGRGIHIGGIISTTPADISIGSQTGSCSLTQRVGTATWSVDGVSNSNYDIGANAVTGTITIGGTAQTGAITIGQSASGHQLNLGHGTDNTINIRTGNAAGGQVNFGGTQQTGTLTLGQSTGSQQIDIGVGAGATTIGIASTTTASSGVVTIGGPLQTGTITFGRSDTAGAKTVAIGNGVSATNINIGTNNTTGTITIGGTSQTGTIRIGQSNSAIAHTINIGTGDGKNGNTTVNIATGAINAKTVNIAILAAVANVVTIGSTTGAATTTFRVGPNNFLFNLTSLTINTPARQLQVRGGAQTDFIGGSVTLAAGIATVLNTNIATTDAVFVSRSVAAGTVGFTFLVTITAATSFVITSYQAGATTVASADTSTVSYFIVRQI